MTCEVCKNKAVKKFVFEIRQVTYAIALCKRCLEDAHSGELSAGDLNIAHRSNLY